MNKTRIKTKVLESPWITKEIKNSPKRKQRLYLNFSTKTNKKPNKNTNFFEFTKKRSKKLYFSKLI